MANCIGTIVVNIVKEVRPDHIIMHENKGYLCKSVKVNKRGELIIRAPLIRTNGLWKW